MQALVAVLPQLFAVFFGLFASLLSLAYWREKFRQHWKTLSFLGLACLALLWATMDRRKPILATLTPSPLTSEAQNWVSFRGELSGAGAGVLGTSTLSGKPKVLWSYVHPKPGSYLASPVAVNGRVFVAFAQEDPLRPVGSIECLDAQSGKLLWSSPTRYPVFCSPIVVENRVYCGEGLHENQACKMFCLDATSGKTLWTFEAKGHLEGTPVLVGDRLLFSAGGDGFYCLEASSGKVLWHNPCGHCDSSPAVTQDRVFLGTAYGDNSALCLDLQSGKTLWKKAQDLPVWGHPALQGGRVYFGLGNGTFGGSDENPKGAVLCLDAQDGRKVWRKSLPDSVNTSICIDSESLFLGCRDGYLYCLSRQDGSLRWKADCGSPLLASLVVQGDTVVAAGGDGLLHALDRSNGKERWALLVSDVPCESSPMLADGRLYLGCGTNLLCLGP